MKINPLTLSFPNPETEREFLRHYFRMSLKQVRFALILAIVVYVILGIVDFQFAPEIRDKLLLVRYGFVLPVCIAVLGLSFSAHFRHIMQVLIGAAIIVTAIAAPVVAILIPTLGVNYIGLTSLLMYNYTAIKLRFVAASITGLIIFLIYNALDLLMIKTPIAKLVEVDFYLAATISVGMFACYQMEFYLRQDYISDRLLKKEQDKAEELLLNVLPASIAARLKQGDKVIAESFPDVTILFADLVNFTQLSANISAKELVNILNEIFSEFDLLAEKHGLEKIKTIGDAYMVVGGLPVHRDDHAQAVASMALDMRAAIQRISSLSQEPLSIRIGINTGPVVAGVIGIKKFIYDLWGDTVNVASRMESHGIPDQIHVTVETYQALQQEFTFQKRDKIQVKGKGEMQTYLLINRKSNGSQSDLHLEICS